jgi:hypothetical protein
MDLSADVRSTELHEKVHFEVVLRVSSALKTFENLFEHYCGWVSCKLNLAATELDVKGA